MVGIPDEEERIQQVKQMIREKKAFIGFLKVSSEKDENEKIKKEILREIDKKQKELEEFIKNNPIEETPQKEYSNEDVPIGPIFINPNATPEIWNPKELMDNYYEDYMMDADYFNGFLKLEPDFRPDNHGYGALGYYQYNLLSSTPYMGLYKDKSMIKPETVIIESILCRISVNGRLKYKTIDIDGIEDPKPILIPTDTEGIYKIHSVFDYDEEVAAPICAFQNFGFKSLPKLQAAVAGTLDTRCFDSCNGDLTLVTAKAINDYLYKSPIIGIKLSGLIHVN